MIFTNLENSLIQKEIKKFCHGKSGVYKITNLKNKKFYIGSAMTAKSSVNRLYIRFRNHFFNYHKLFPITNAIIKYGVYNFSWEIIEFTELENTRSRETYYIQLLKPEYNILQSAESNLGYKHTPQTREKIKQNYSEKRRQTIGNLNKGKTLSIETRQKIALAVLNRSIDVKIKHQQACEEFNRKKFSKATQVVDGNTHETLGTYTSLTATCRAWNGDYRTFIRAVKSGTVICKLNIYVKYIS